MWAMKEQEMQEEQARATSPPSISVWEGTLACVFVILLCLAALVWVLFAPIPDRSFRERPVLDVDAQEAARVEQNAARWEGVLLSLGRCIYCPGQPMPVDLWAHLQAQHTSEQVRRAWRLKADQWHLAAGVP